MSATIQSMIDRAAERMAYLNAVRERFPDAKPYVLWDDGPEVLCIERRDAATIATRIEAVINGKVPSLVAYLEIDVPGSPVKGRVYVIREWWDQCSANVALYRMSADEHKALVEAVFRR